MEAPSNATAHAKIMKMRQKIGVQKRVNLSSVRNLVTTL